MPIHAASRREFLRIAGTVGAGVVAGVNPGRAADSPNARLRIAIMGCNGRGLDHIAAWLAQPNVEIAWVCDVDQRAVTKGLAAVAKKQTAVPRSGGDFRRALDDRDVDVLSVAAPNHWHAPATILACSAGKHVYVEKPGSHNPREGELMIAAARRHKRVVQMGNQRRSWPWMQDVMSRLHGGVIGEVRFARAWYTNHRGSMGRGQVVPVPGWLDWTLWQGPAPDQPFMDNLVHYNWHWRWHWGGGETANNGPHSLDLIRWGLGVDCPRRVTCGGGRYHFQDDQETPDTVVATFDFGTKGASWEAQSCAPRGFEGEKFGVTFLGEKGSLVIAGNQTRIYDLNDREQASIPSRHGGDAVHFANCAAAIRDGRPANSEIGEAQKSTLLCHLANIAWRTGHTLDLDPATRRLVPGNTAAEALWGRTYRPGWEPQA